jgi:hypothetical protein
MKYNFLEATSNNLPDCPGTFDWEGTDKKKLLKMHSKRKLVPQAQLNRTVQYTLNSHGYRCPEFDTIDWQNTIVTLGCSHTFGIGVDDSEIYARLLQDKLGTPVVSLGMGGTDIWFQVYNAIELMKLNVRGVVLQVPNKERFTIFGEGNQSTNYGSWNMKKYKQIINIWGTDFNLLQWHSFGYDYIEKMLGNKLLFKFSLTTCDHLPMEKIFGCDLARDNSHPGPKTHKKIAEIIAKELNYEVN